MCKLTNVVFVIIIEFLCTKWKTRFTSIPSYKNKKHRRYCSSSSVIVIFIKRISIRFAKIYFLNIILSRVLQGKSLFSYSLTATKKLDISVFVFFTSQISKVILEMNLNVIEELNILVLVDNKTDSLSSIPDLVPGKSQFARIFLCIALIYV